MGSLPTSSIPDLRQRSVEVILAGQAAGGGYVAAPGFPPYGYSWLRDGSFVADAMSRVGEVESAEAFFGWVARIVEGGLGFEARYTVAGELDQSEWPHRQHDGWGLWLWAVRGHRERHRRPHRWQEAAALTERHLEAVRHEPCVDWWEEREGIHAATLACIAAGLGDEPDLERAERRLDGSLLVLPLLGFGGVDVGSLVSPGGGVHRHRDDTYYGGGEWLLLTAMLGLAEPDRAEDCLSWIAAHATADGLLPEQSQDHLLAPERYDEWVAKWGPPPCPLLWSHAMFLTLTHELGA
jgi:GH15 family glucan-1,4-alpha-glucosidase